MKCPTCHFDIPSPVHFCPHCGWPAARLTAEIQGDVLGVPTSGEASVPLILKNVGAGHVEYQIRLAAEQPWAFLVGPQGRKDTRMAERRLRPGDLDNALRVGVVGDEVAPDRDNVLIEVESSDMGGEHSEAFRPWSVSKHRWRRWQVHVPLRHLGQGEAYLGQDLIIFSPRHREGTVRVQNRGGTPARVLVEEIPRNVRGSWQSKTTEPKPAEGVLEVTFEEQAPYVDNARQPQALPADGVLELALRADDTFEGQDRLVIITGNDRHELTLFAEASMESASLLKHYTVGIDFGTAKSAVYYTDNWVSVEDREPRPILWPAGPNSEERTETTTRSAVMYEAGSDVPRCGHRVPVSAGAETADQAVVESIKTRLRAETADEPLMLTDGRSLPPVAVVGEFMRYLVEEVRGCEPFRGKVDMDARMVLTLPVMEDRDAFFAQRRNTLRAADTAGLPVDALLTPSEPECAALDLLHSLRRGQYTFNEKTYHLQDKEGILVFDCGAGTTDIALLRVLLSRGTFEAEQICAAGYRFGGDTVDDLLLSWLLDQRSDQLRIFMQGREPMLEFQDLIRPIPLHAARDECRRLKESLFAPGAPREKREFHTDLGAFELSPAHVERLVAPFLDTMFTAGVMPDPALFFKTLNTRLDTLNREAADFIRRALWREMTLTARTRVRTLAQAMKDAGVRNGDVSFLFITGGTGQIPLIASRLYDVMGRSARIVVATPEDCTVNVARGAALYYDYRVSGIMQCAVDVVGRDPENDEELFRERVCSPGALPGLNLDRAVLIGSRRSVEVALHASYPSGPAGDLAGHVVRNPSGEARQLIVNAEYSNDHTLYWRAEFAGGQVAIPREAALRL